ncbi:hypothetical protein ACQ4PT_048932 [Festuca glaucescens]
MEGRRVADVAADAKIGALIGADGLESTIGAHGGAAGGSAAGRSEAIVAAADLELKQDLPVGDALLPDLQLKKASDAISDVEVKGGMQAVQDSMEVGQKMKWVIESDDSDNTYVSSDVSSGDAVSYMSASSVASSEGDVNKYNILSYPKRVEEKIWDEGLDAYIKMDGKYYYKFHPFKQVPRDGSREGLVAHAKTVAHKDLCDKANHAALITFPEYYGQD